MGHPFDAPYALVKGEGNGMAIRKLGYVVLTLKFEQERNKWVGTCVELGTSTYGRSLKQTFEALNALVVEHLDILEELGEREQFFQKWDIEFYEVQPQPTQVRKAVPDDDWVRFIRTALASHPRTLASHYGPFYQPGVFPITQGKSESRSVLVGA